MSDDKTNDKKKPKKIDVKPESPTLAVVLAAHAVFVDGLARLPDARQRDERDQIHEAIGRGHRILMEAAGYRSVPAEVPLPSTAEDKDDSEAHRRQLALGQALGGTLEWLTCRVRQLDSGSPMALVSAVADGIQWLDGMGQHMGLADQTDVLEEFRTLREEAKQALDGYYAQQPATEEPTKPQ